MNQDITQQIQSLRADFAAAAKHQSHTSLWDKARGIDNSNRGADYTQVFTQWLDSAQNELQSGNKTAATEKLKNMQATFESRASNERSDTRPLALEMYPNTLLNIIILNAQLLCRKTFDTPQKVQARADKRLADNMNGYAKTAVEFEGYAQKVQNIIKSI